MSQEIIHNFNSEEQRLRYVIYRFKEYDSKRNAYIKQLEAQCEAYRARVDKLQAEIKNERKQAENTLAELIQSYDKASPLISNPDNKAYVFQLLQRIEQLKNK